MSSNDIEISKGLTEDGVVVGNTYDKYNSINPIVNWMMNEFHNTLDSLVNRSKPSTIHEIGCGEGYWTIEYQKRGVTIVGSDFSDEVINIAKRNATAANADPDIFRVKSIYELDIKEDSADLIVCCEVLEHLEEPHTALEVLTRLECKNLIISVPNEPIWRILNMVRLKYIRNLGNTPGHIQHWSKKKFVALVSNYFKVKEVHSPFPWTMLYCSPREKNNK